MITRIRENLRIFRDIRAGIDADRQRTYWRGLDAAARKANTTPQKIEQSLKAINSALNYISNDRMAQEFGLDVDLMLAHEHLTDAVTDCANHTTN